MKANITGSSYEEKVKDARESLAKDTMKREVEREANPIDWKATMETGKVVFKKTK